MINEPISKTLIKPRQNAWFVNVNAMVSLQSLEWIIMHENHVRMHQMYWKI